MHIISVYSNDIRGSVTAIADEANSYVETCFYDIYGEPEIWKSLDGGIYNEIYYTGAIYDAATGLYYLSSRYYDSEIGRFTSMDSVRGDAKNPLSLNLYGYCEGNPVKYTDEEGENPILLGAAVGFATGFGGEILGQVISGEKVNIKKALVSGVIGAITGALSFTGVAVNKRAVDVAINLAGGIAENLAQSKISGKKLTTKDYLLIAGSSVVSLIGVEVGAAGLKRVAQSKAERAAERVAEDSARKLEKNYTVSTKTMNKLEKNMGKKHAKKLKEYKVARRAVIDYSQKMPRIKQKRLASKESSRGRTSIVSLMHKTVKALVSRKKKIKCMSQYRYSPAV